MYQWGYRQLEDIIKNDYNLLTLFMLHLFAYKIRPIVLHHPLL